MWRSREFGGVVVPYRDSYDDDTTKAMHQAKRWASAQHLRSKDLLAGTWRQTLRYRNPSPVSSVTINPIDCSARDS
jgi:hypothetical protein